MSTEQIARIYKAGMDVGSTTVKLVIVNESGAVLFSDYRRHNADLGTAIVRAFLAAFRKIGDCTLDIAITGSVGMGIANRFDLLFIQEVVAAVTLIEQRFPNVRTFIDIGGEDAKMIFFRPQQAPDIRMNGSCAGGTGAFIDQMASLLGVPVSELSDLAENAEKTYPIASRCGVFSKTDVQNLVSRNVSKADIAASIFHAVAMQTMSALSRGYDVVSPVFFCGGPLAFIPALRRAFTQTLSLQKDDCIFDEYAHIVPAWGCAVTARTGNRTIRLSELLRNAKHMELSDKSALENRLPKLFDNQSDFENWRKKKCNHFVDRIAWKEIAGPCFLGIDSGSTTTKIVVTDSKERVLFDYYARNEGNSLQAVLNGLESFRYTASQHNKQITIAASAVTGYGENLIKAAFNLDFGMVETIAHYLAARKISPEVSFILDIGGQDMKAVFIDNGTIRRLEINEACSSGCGSFIEGFANMLNLPVAEFAQMACSSENPCDLGTRCTVFMNSKVKQALKEDADIADIAAGLSYSVIKNCLYKVLKLKDVADLGEHIVVQGGTFRNLSIVRALELLTGADVSFSDIPELMGAYGSALYAKQHAVKAKTVPLEQLLSMESFATDLVQCKGCENNCFVKKFKFSNGNNYYSGNKCERIFSNKTEEGEEGLNLYNEKLAILFDRDTLPDGAFKLRVGLPRGLNMFENYPFWHTLLMACDIQPVLSAPSTFVMYEKGLNSVMSDNICFPAKLMHGHILNLIHQKVDRILFPYVVFEQKEDSHTANSYNCPVVTGYSDVIKAGINTAEKYGVPLDAPTIVFNDDKLLFKAIKKYLSSIGVPEAKIKNAFTLAQQAQEVHFKTLSKRAAQIAAQAKKENRMVILLAGRPYHTDPLVQHKVSEYIAKLGVDVITEDITRTWNGAAASPEIQSVSQWAYPNRIFKAAQYVADSTDNIHYVQLTSFGCGPDAFIVDEVSDILKRKGKNLTLLKIDDVNNIGSLRLRIRSMVESLKFGNIKRRDMPFFKTPAFTKDDRHRKIIAPYFAEGYSELLPELFHNMGVDLEVLPPSDSQSVEQGLRYVNNEVCYPAILVVGDIVKALKSDKYSRHEIAVAITQTGGQCRATNYIASIKKAMQTAGFGDIPVVSVAFGNDVFNEQPGFELKLTKGIMTTLFTLLFADCLTKFYYAALVREKEKGAAARLRQKYLELAKPIVASRNRKELYRLTEQAAEEFNTIIEINDHVPIIGVVGEIYVKYNSFSHKNVLQWLADQGVEVVAPSLYNFFISAFVNMRHNHHANIKRNSMPLFVNDIIYRWVYYYAKNFDKYASKFRYYRPFSDLYDDAEKASKIINLSAQFGEGWLIPAELASFAEHGIYNALSLQPFGCIANHVISKGIEKRVREVYPQMQMLFLDFDADTSEANVLNRLHFMIKNAKDQAHGC